MNTSMNRWPIFGIILATTLFVYGCGSIEKKTGDNGISVIQDEIEPRENKKNSPTFMDLRGYLLPTHR